MLRYYGEVLHLIPKIRMTPLALSVLGGVLTGSAFLEGYLWFLFVPGLICLFGMVHLTEKGRSAFFLGWLFGTIKMLIVLSWFWSTYPLEWMLIGSFGSVVAIGAYWFLVSVVIGLGFGLCGITSWWIYKKTVPHLQFVTVPALLVLSEISGSIFFSLFMYGEGGAVNAAFSYGYIGYLLNEHEILRSTAYGGGVYVLSFLASFIGFALFYVLQKWKNPLRTRFVVAGVFTILFLVSAVVPLRSEQEEQKLGIRVALIGTHFDMDDVFGNPAVTKEKQRQAVQRALAYTPHYIAFPEDAKYTENRSNEEIFAELRNGGSQSILIDSYRTKVGTASVLRAYVFQSDTDSVYTFDKRYLVPQGEYVPTFYRGLFWAFGLGSYFDYRTMNTDLTPGTGTHSDDIPEVIPGILFCSENIPPYFLAGIMRERPIHFVVNPISHTWFNNPRSLWNETHQMTAIQAIQNAIPIVQPGNRMPSKAYDARGKELQPIVRESMDGTSVSIYEL